MKFLKRKEILAAETAIGANIESRDSNGSCANDSQAIYLYQRIFSGVVRVDFYLLNEKDHVFSKYFFTNFQKFCKKNDENFQVSRNLYLYKRTPYSLQIFL